MSLSAEEVVTEVTDIVSHLSPSATISEDVPLYGWESFIIIEPQENEKKLLNKAGLYSPGSSNVCNKYATMSDSTILRHPYYNYPAVHDPGIKEALLYPEQPVLYSDDGQDLYLNLCSELNLPPVRMFHKDLLTSEINLSYYGVDPRNVCAMAMALQFNKHVNIFNLTDNFLSDDSCYHLGQILKTNSAIKELNLNGCRIGSSGLLNLGKNFIFNRTLERLNLARNQLGDVGGVNLAKFLSDGATIKKVNLSGNNLGRETALALVEAFEWKNPLIELDLSWNNFLHIPSTVKMLSQLANSELLQELNLSANSLEGDKVATAVCDILRIPSLKVLDLSYNRFRNEAIDIIMPGLKKAKKLITFNLSFNPMTPEDAYNTLQRMLTPRVKLHNLLMENVCVKKDFLVLLQRVSKMKVRKHFKVIYGDVLQNWTVEEPDVRGLLLKRAEYLGRVGRKKSDILIYFLRLYDQSQAPVIPKDLLEKMKLDKIHLTEDYINQLTIAFPGPRLRKIRTIDIGKVCEYIRRLWPDKKIPVPKPDPDPVSKPEPEPASQRQITPVQPPTKKTVGKRNK